jgi:hypothetical protein
VILKGKMLWLAVYSCLSLLLIGCSGINASKSVSPMDILPFLLQADPSPALPGTVLAAVIPVEPIPHN